MMNNSLSLFFFLSLSAARGEQNYHVRDNVENPVSAQRRVCVYIVHVACIYTGAQFSREFGLMHTCTRACTYTRALIILMRKKETVAAALPYVRACISIYIVCFFSVSQNTKMLYSVMFAQWRVRVYIGTKLWKLRRYVIKTAASPFEKEEKFSSCAFHLSAWLRWTHV